MIVKPILEAKNLWCVYQEKLIFHNVNLTLQAGHCICIQGHNGSGKSSLLQMLAGFMRPYQGTIINDSNISMRLVGQPDGLTSELTVEEMEGFWDELYGEALTRIFTLSKQINSLVSTLSRGERQKLALNKLHHGHSKLWLLDEPFTALDKHGCQALGTAIHHQLDRGGSVIFTAHEPMDLPFKVNHTLILEAPC